MSLLRFATPATPKPSLSPAVSAHAMGAGQTSLPVPEEPIGADPTLALNTGYVQSKYIGTDHPPSAPISISKPPFLMSQSVERLTQTAATSLRIPIRVLRVGQLASSTRTGH